MITAYAMAEAGVHCHARYLSGLPDAKARAIFGRMRLPDLTDLVRQMMRINGTPDDICQEVDACLAQLDVIASQRHKLVHRMVDYTGSCLSVSNLLTSKSLAAIERDVFSHRDLQNMHADCVAIFHRFLMVRQPEYLILQTTPRLKRSFLLHGDIGHLCEVPGRNDVAVEAEVKPYQGPPMTLESAAAKVRLMGLVQSVWSPERT
jgi:hypothetical protein